MADLCDLSLQELEPGTTSVDGESHLNAEIRRLLRTPLRQLRLEDLRLLIGQGIGLRFLIPRAIEHVEGHPLAAGDFYPGDLLKQVAEVEESFWQDRPELRLRLVTALERALERIRKVRTPVQLEGELRASLGRHRRASRKAV